MSQIQGSRPEPKHKIDSGGNPASSKANVDGGSLVGDEAALTRNNDGAAPAAPRPKPNP